MSAAFCREMVEDRMRETFIEMFSDEIVEARVCSNRGEK